MSSDQLLDVIKERLDAGPGLGRGRRGRPCPPRRADRPRPRSGPAHLAVPGDRPVQQVARLVHVALRQVAAGLGVHRVFHVHQLGEEGQRPGRLHLVGMDEVGLLRAAVLLVVLKCSGTRGTSSGSRRPRDLNSLGELVDGGGDHVLLAVAVEQDLLAEAHVPQAGHDALSWPMKISSAPRSCQACPGGGRGASRTRSGWATVQPASLGHRLGHPRHQKGVLADAGVGPMGLGRADRHDDQVVLLQPLVDLLPGHVLQIDLVGRLHVAAFGGNVHSLTVDLLIRTGTTTGAGIENSGARRLPSPCAFCGSSALGSTLSTPGSRHSIHLDPELLELLLRMLLRQDYRGPTSGNPYTDFHPGLMGSWRYGASFLGIAQRRLFDGRERARGKAARISSSTSVR